MLNDPTVDSNTSTQGDFSNPEVQPSFIPPIGSGTSLDQSAGQSFFSGLQIPSASTVEDRSQRYDFALGQKSPGQDQLASEISSGGDSASRAQRSLEERTDLNLRRATLLQGMLKTLPAGTIKPEDIDQIQTMDRKAVDDAYADPKLFYEKKFATRAIQTATADSTDASDSKSPITFDASQHNDILVNQTTARKLYEDAQDGMKDRTTIQAAKEWAPLHRWIALESSDSSGFLLGTNTKKQIQDAYRLSPDEFLKTTTAKYEELKAKDPSLALEYASALLGYTASNEFTDNLFSILDLTMVPTIAAGAVSLARRAFGSAIPEVVSNYANNIRMINTAGRLKGLNIDLAAGRINYVDILPAERQAQAIALDSIRTKATSVGQGAQWDELAKSIQPIINPQSVLEGGTNMSAEEAARLEVSLLRTSRNSITNLISRPSSLERLSSEELATAQSEAEKYVETMYAQTTRASRVIKIQSDNIGANENLANTDFISTHYGTAKATGFASEQSAVQGAKKLEIDQYTTENINGQWYIKTVTPVDEKSTTLQAFRRPSEKFEDKRGRSWWSPIASAVRMRDSIIPEQLAEDFKVSHAYTNQYFKSNRDQFISDFSGLNKQSRQEMDAFMSRERDYRNQTSNTEVQRGQYAKNVGEFQNRFQTEMGRTPTFQETKTYFSWQQWNDIDYATRNLDLTRDMTRLQIQGHQFRFRVPGQDQAYYTPSLEGKAIEHFPWEREGDAGILVWDTNPQMGSAGNSGRKIWIPEKSPEGSTVGKSIRENTFGSPGRLSKEYIDDLTHNKGYRVYQLAPHSKQKLADTMASYGGVGDKPVPPTTAFKMGPETPEGVKGYNPPTAAPVFQSSMSYGDKINGVRRLINEQHNNPNKTSYYLSDLFSKENAQGWQLGPEGTVDFLNKAIRKGDLEAFSDETGAKLTSIPLESVALDTKNEGSDIALKFKNEANPGRLESENQYINYRMGRPYIQNSRTLEELRTNRAKVDYNYRISPESHMQPNPYHELEDLMHGDLSNKENELFQAHGIQNGDVDQNLFHLLEEGINPKRTLHTGPLKPSSEAQAAGFNTKIHGSPYVLLSDPGKSLTETGVKNIVLQRASAGMKISLTKAFPDINFMTPKQARKFIKDGARNYKAPAEVTSKLDIPTEYHRIKDLQDEGKTITKSDQQFLDLHEPKPPIIGVGQHNIGDEVYRLNSKDKKELLAKGKLEKGSATATGKINSFYYDEKYGHAAQLDNGSLVPTNELYKPGSTVNNVTLSERPQPESARKSGAYEGHDYFTMSVGGEKKADIHIQYKDKKIILENIDAGPYLKETSDEFWSSAQPKTVKANMDLDTAYMQKHVGSKALNGGVAATSDPTTTYGTLSHSTYTLKNGEKVIETVKGYSGTGANEIALWRKDGDVWYKIATAKKGNKGDLEHIVVAPEYQKQGIGQYLAKKAKTTLDADITKTTEFSQAGAGLANKLAAEPTHQLPGSNTLGPQTMRKLFQVLHEKYPEATEIQGLHVTGAVRKSRTATNPYPSKDYSIPLKPRKPEVRFGEAPPPPERPGIPELPPGPSQMKGWEIPNYDYIIAKPEQDVKSANIGFQRFPRQEGGHKIATDDWQLRQPKIYTHKEPGLNPKTTIHTYEGDVNAYSAVLEGDARDFHTHAENIRNILDHDLENGTNNAESYYNQYMDGTSKNFKDFKNQFREFNKNDGHLTTKIPFVVTPKNKSSWDYIHSLTDAEGKPVFQNLQNSRDSAHNLFHNELNLKFALERGDNLESVVRKGTVQAPVFGTADSGRLSPMTTMINTTSDMLRGRVIDDLKLKSAENFGKAYAAVIDGSAESIRNDPMSFIINPQWKQGLKGEDLALLRSAKDYRRALVDFLGIENPEREFIMNLQRSTGDFLKRRLGQGSYDWVDRHLLRSTTLTPVRWANNVVFDLFQGALNLKQVITQGVSSYHVAAVLGPKMGLEAGFMAHAARFLIFNDRPELANWMARAIEKTTLGGVKKEWFLEGTDSLKKSGWGIIGQGTAIQDDFINQSIKPSFIERSREAGRVFFKEGERFAKNTAYMGAYMEWRTANPLMTLTPRIEHELLNRADTLSFNMTSASNAAMAKGVAGIPLKYTAYYLRFMEQMMPGWNDFAAAKNALVQRSLDPLRVPTGSGPLTPIEKMRAYAMYSAAFGAPITASGVFGLWPLHKEYAKMLMEKGHTTDENQVQNFFNNGLAQVLPSLLGINHNVSEAVGPSGTSWLYDIYNGRSPIFDIVTGVAGTKMLDTFENAWPFFTFMANAFRTDEKMYPLSWADLEALARSPSSVNNLWKSIQMANTGIYATKSMTPLARGMTIPDSLMTLLAGTEPMSVQTAFLQTDILKATKDMKDSVKKDILRYHRLQMKSIVEGDLDGAIQYGKEMRYNIIKGGFRADEMNGLFSDAVTANSDLVHLAQRNFQNSTPERQKMMMDKAQGLESNGQ